MAKKFSFESCELIAPVTALEFTKTELFIGEGAYVSAYETTNGNRIAIQRVFQHQRVHCIRVFDVNNLTTIVVCGGKAASILHFQQSPSESVISVVNTTLLCDWIWDICLLDGSVHENSLHVALATGHNAVWLWNASEDTKFRYAQCEEQCILYCARLIGHTLEKMWLACGTVFNDVLLWKVANKMNDDRVCVSRRLKGHDGVIFSIACDEERQILCSVSDDRSVKVWRLGSCFEKCGNSQVESEPLFVLYGHKARVWDCLITSDYIVTIGEDSTCLVWNSKGEIIKMFKGHIGKSIWSLAVDQNKQVISTGGGDGSVRLWSLGDDKENVQRQQHSFSTMPQKNTTFQPDMEIPRSLAFLPNNNVLVMTNNGNFYSYNWSQDGKEKCQTECWDFYQNEPGFCSYSLMVLSPCCTIMALGNIHGNIKLLSTIDSLWCAHEMKSYKGKILSLHWIEYNQSEKALNLFSCGPDGCIIWWTVGCLDTKKVFLCEVKAYFRLPYCRQRWPNSIFIQPEEMASLEVTHFEQDTNEPLVLCGDRRGSLHIFKANGKKDLVDPLHSHIGIHGRNGITHITSHDGFIYTTGRDGYFRQYKFCGTNLELVDERKVYKGLDWIAQLKFNSDGDTLVLGFHAIDFVIWSMRRNEILLRIPCGGGHRTWDFHYTESDVEKSIMFAYLKKLTVHVHKLSENKIVKIPHSSIFQESFHGREATCVCFVASQQCKNKERSQLHVLATGSEDTNINIMAYNPAGSQKKLCKIFTCQGHVSSVRCMTLAKVKCSDEGKPTPYDLLLFSGGGRALLKCWSVNLTDIIWNEENCETVRKLDKSLHPVCTLLAELPHHVRHYRKKKVPNEVMGGTFFDTRFMSVSVFWFPDLVPSKTWQYIYGIIIGCSDGSLRMYLLNTSTKNFNLIGQCCWGDKCILCVGHMIHTCTSSVNHRLVIYAADTAGRITLWDFSELFMEYISEFVHKSNEEQEMSSEKKASTVVDVVPAIIEGLDINTTDTDDFKDSLSQPDIDSQTNKTNTDMAFSAEPFFIYNLHQSGINAVSLVRQDSGQYLVCTGGDDGALAFAVFNLQEKHKRLMIHTWDTVAVLEAHTSSVTGVKIFGDNLVLSCSVDQRLKFWNIDIDLDSKMSVTLNDSHFVDVSDVQDIDVQCNGDGCYNIAICGVGLQLLTLNLLVHG